MGGLNRGPQVIFAMQLFCQFLYSFLLSDSFYFSKVVVQLLTFR